MDATQQRAPGHPKLSKGGRGGGRRSSATAPQRGRRSGSLQHGRPPASSQRRVPSACPQHDQPQASPQLCLPSASPQHDQHPASPQRRRRNTTASRQRGRGRTVTASPQRCHPSGSPEHGRPPASPQRRRRRRIAAASPQRRRRRIADASPQRRRRRIAPASPQRCRRSVTASPQQRLPSTSPKHGRPPAFPQHRHRPSASPAGSSRPAQPRSSSPGAERAGRTVGRWSRCRRGGMALSQQCEAAFGTADLYGVLGVRRGASEKDIRRGYHRASLRLHPDRVPAEQKEEATRHFQILGKVYAVLSDEKQRAVYDETGMVDEDAEGLQDGRDWLEYWQLLFKLTVKDIEEFKSSYKNSEEELADVKAAYVNFKGDMDRIMKSVLCVDYTDEPRIREMIQRAIDSGEVPSFKAFVKESKQKMMARRKRAEKEAKEAKKTLDEMGLSGENDLQALIKRRSKERAKEMDDFITHLEAKYGNNGNNGNTAKKGGKKTSGKKRKAEGTA